MHKVAITTLAFLIGAFYSMAVVAADITPFVGTFEGSAELRLADGTIQPRDMSVSIEESAKGGFSVEWASVSYKPDGRRKAKTYNIAFTPTDRGSVFSAAMRRNVFGHAEPLDPMKGEPYVWSRVEGDTLTVYSLYISAEGGYELQQFDRTLAEGGLTLHFKRFSNGVLSREVETFLKRTSP